MKRISIWMMTLLLAMAAPVVAQAPERPPQRAEGGLAGDPGRIQTPTRFVTIFTNLENQLLEALVRNDAVSAGRLLTDDFAQWSPEPPGAPTPREEWLKPDRRDMANSRVRQMSAKDFGDFVVVNYVLTSDLPKAFFIVDVWKKAGGDYQLSSRYLSAVDRAPYAGPARPTGKN